MRSPASSAATLRSTARPSWHCHTGPAATRVNAATMPRSTKAIVLPEAGASNLRDVLPAHLSRFERECRPGADSAWSTTTACKGHDAPETARPCSKLDLRRARRDPWPTPLDWRPAVDPAERSYLKADRATASVRRTLSSAASRQRCRRSSAATHRSAARRWRHPALDGLAPNMPYMVRQSEAATLPLSYPPTRTAKQDRRAPAGLTPHAADGRQA